MPRSKDDIREEIAQEEARLEELERARKGAEHRIAELRQQLRTASVSEDLPLSHQRETPQTSAQKIELFRSLFRGRTDVFPTRFVSRKTG
jgi:hypothetical protein